VLAAGRGTRLGSPVPKPLLVLCGRPLVSWALDAPRASGLEPVLCVVGWHARAVRSVMPAEVEVVRGRHWRRGIAHSLRAALDALEPRGGVDAVVVGLADQPLVGAEAYRRLAVAHAGGARLAVATYAGRRGNPVLLDRSLWCTARALRGDVGARALMTSETVTDVDCTGTGSPGDVDTLEDLNRLEDRLASEARSARRSGAEPETGPEAGPEAGPGDPGDGVDR
jgi:nicotine blue oxidoreductase